MKKLLFLFAITGLIFTGCNDDDDDSSQNPGGNNPPVSDSFSASINGESLSGSDNFVRELSYGDFMIRTEADGNQLKFILSDFSGNSNYTLGDQNTQNFALYSTDASGEVIDFESTGGQISIENFDPATGSFDATFNITFQRIGNSSVTITGEGTYSGLVISEIQEPEVGGITVFYNEEEYFSFEDSIVRFSNGVVTLNLTETENGFEISGFLPSIISQEVELKVEASDLNFQGGEIISYNVDTSNAVLSGRFKNADTNSDFELWINKVPFETDDMAFSISAEFNYGDTLILLEAPIFRQLQILFNGSVSYLYIFEAGSDDANLRFDMAPPFFAGPEFNQTVNGFSSFDYDAKPELEFPGRSATMTFQEGLLENTVDVVIEIDGSGTVVASSVPIQE
ncbi:MAG: hypothetical protein AAGC47_01555 [Bacteroidota bacterium]